MLPDLKPTYWASVSGGKDSLYMLKIILMLPDKYPLDGVVHFELEIDYPFITEVVDYMEAECKSHSIPFVRIKPRKTWYELYERFGFPTRKARWCNGRYKLDAKRQLDAFMKSRGKRVISYIGYCADEEKRFTKRRGLQEIYPLVDLDIVESDILAWAKTVPIFNNYYVTQKRCGCMYCPLASLLNYAYLLKYYPEHYQRMIAMMADTELKLSERYGRPIAITQSNGKYNAAHVDNSVRTKFLPKLERLEREYFGGNDDA